jgi:FKBP-type peptidyl-prolyl cis-trans isomerase FklB
MSSKRIKLLLTILIFVADSALAQIVYYNVDGQSNKTVSFVLDKTIQIKNEKDSLSYAFGIIYFNYFKNDSIYLDPMIVAKAMLDGEKGEPLMTDEDARSFLKAFGNRREADKVAKIKVTYKDHIAENTEFLENNKQRTGVKVTPSGLQYEVIKMGKGPKPTIENTVKVHYVGTLIDGTEFDSSIERNEPATFPVSGVIPGWIEALQLMPVGSKFKLYIPEDLAYGESGAGEVIKPYSTLIFEIELIEIVK